MSSLLVHSGTLVDARSQRPGWIVVRDGRVSAVGSADDQAPRVERSIDASGGFVTPGFVDIHVNGAGGHHFDDGIDEARAALAAMRAHGTTRSVASFVTAPITHLLASAATVRQVMDVEPGVLGVHVEGPFLAPARRGAHDGTLLCHPEPAAVDRLLDLEPGLLRKVTIAPELPGAMDAIERFVAAGVRVAVGHTACDHDTAREAFARGASLVTHAFNAMGPIAGREPGVIGAAIAADHVTIEVIADGIHVHPASIALLFAAAPGRIALVTDAIAAAAAPEGRYVLGGLDVDVADGRAVVAGTDTLAGSTLTTDRALRVVVEQCGIALHDAVGALTQVPAAAIGEADSALLEVGARGDLVVFDGELTVSEVIVAGVAQASSVRSRRV